MRKKGFLFLFSLCFLTIGYAYGAVRSASTTNARGGTIQKTPTARAATNTRARVAQTPIQRTVSTKRNATTQKPKQNVSVRTGLISPIVKRVVGRAATVTDTDMIQNFGSEYSTCHDAYFTCMDQFCANLDDTYRRCICSSRLNEIKKKQSALTQTSDSLTAFHDFNLDIITKSAAEVNAMTSATTGEMIASTSNDKTASGKQLNAISSVLAKTKNKSLSTAGTLDAGGDIKSIWNTTDLASGANIANLTGETLYNAVNAQCADMVAEQCPQSILNMVISAYGMYIENDCATLATNLSKQKNTANTTIRETERAMGNARLENYNAHNSLSINDCIASIRTDITANTACGDNFVHCLDVTGLYLNIDTGAPIYTENFYNLANQISLSGNILNNQKNHMIVNALNNKKKFAEKSLDKCRDLSGDIWDEFMRQAIIEIHQIQQEKIRTVKNECLGVVNQCYDTQTNQLKDFSNKDSKTLLGLNLETVEDLCQEKLDTCSNLYGGGPNGLTKLLNAMHDIVDQKIAAECQSMLFDFGQNLCSVQSTDTLHSYPYACRTYIPGDQRYATIANCNSGDGTDCGDYNNSLYQRFVNYAMQVCIRPSEYEILQNNVPTSVLQDINIVMDKMHISMSNELSRECERFGGIWVTNPYTNTKIELQEQFYTETGSNKQWGYCKSPAATVETYIVTFNDGQESGNTFSSVVTFGETMNSITPPQQDGTAISNFCGYYENETNTKYFDANGKPVRNWDIASNTTLYARYGNEEHVYFEDTFNVFTNMVNPDSGDETNLAYCPNAQSFTACDNQTTLTCKPNRPTGGCPSDSEHCGANFYCIKKRENYPYVHYVIDNIPNPNDTNNPIQDPELDGLCCENENNKSPNIEFDGWCDGTCDVINTTKNGVDVKASICNGNQVSEKDGTVTTVSPNTRYCAMWTRYCIDKDSGVIGGVTGGVTGETGDIYKELMRL